MVERLLAAGANANAALLNGETVLMTCARAGDAAAVKALLARGADVNAKEREHQQTALMWAAAQRHPDGRPAAASRRGADVRARSLHLPADRRRRADAARRARGAELHGAARRRTPLLFAARVGDVESAALLLEGRRGRRTTRSRTASARWCSRRTAATAAVAALLLEHGADPNAIRQRLHGAACGDAEKRSDPGARRCSHAAPIRTCGSPRARRCGATPRTGICRRR